MAFSRLPDNLLDDSRVWITIPLTVAHLANAKVKFDLPLKTKVAISLPDLVRQTNAFSVKRRPGCEAKLQKSRPKELFLEYNVTCHEKDSNPAGHDVQVQFDVDDVEKTQDAKKLDVKCSCSCVAPGTMVKMADGTEKPIEQVKIGDWVITHRGRSRQVTAIMNRPARIGERAWETKSEGYRDSLVLSNDHPMAVVRGYELCACGCGEYLQPLGYQNVNFRQRWERKFIKGHYKRGEDSPDTLSQGKFNWKVPFELVKRECLYFPRIEWAGKEKVDNDLAALTGYYLAEGSVPMSLKKKGRWGNKIECKESVIISWNGEEHRVRGVVFTLNQNERHTIARDIETRAKRLYGNDIEVKIKDCEHGGRKWLTVWVKSPNLAASVVRAVGRGSSNKRLSPWVLGWSSESMVALVSSYALGDGYLSDDSQSVFSVSRDLISQISMFLFSLGIWHGWTYHLKKGAKNTSFRLNWNYRDYPQILEAMLPVMREEDKSRATNRLEKEKCWGDCRDREWNDGFIRSLRSKIRVAAPSLFHDLTVDEDESFIANGVVVHNCPAFLYWGAQWNLHQRDGLQGEARPLLKAPTERLDLRNNFVICKHCKTVFERILPAVQHNIVKIVRDLEVRKNKERLEEQPPSPKEKKLRERQEEMRHRKEIDKIVEVEDEDKQKKLIDDLLHEEESRLEGTPPEPMAPPPAVRHEPAPAPAPKPEEKAQVVTRDEPAVAPAPAKAAPPAPKQPDMADLIRQEEKRLQKRKEPPAPAVPTAEQKLRRKRTSLEASLLEKISSDNPRPQGFKDRLDDREIADYVETYATYDVDSELVQEHFRGAHAELMLLPIASLRPGGRSTNLQSPENERKYMKMDINTMPPLLVENGKVLDGNHRLRVLKKKGLTHAWCYVVTDDETGGEKTAAGEWWRRWRKTFVIPKGTVLYHGTNQRFSRAEISTPAWFSTSPSVAEHFSTQHGEEKARILKYETTHTIRLPLIESKEDLGKLGDIFNVDFNFGPEDTIDAIQDAGLPGWIIPSNYPDGNDILLSSSEYITPIYEHGEEDEYDEVE